MKSQWYVCLICLSHIAWASPDDTEIPYAYLPLTSIELGQPFPLQKIADIAPNQAPKLFSVPAGSGKAQLSWQDESPQHPEKPLTLTGKDLAGKPWQVSIARLSGCAPTRIYHADLDKNGQEDVVVVRSTCGNGLAAPTVISIITFETNGRPVLFSSNSYFEDKNQQVDALRDLDQDGKADLLDMTFNNGYWASNVYQLNDAAHWQRVQGQLASRSYPLFTRFTRRPNREPVQPNKPHWVRDFSNHIPVITANLRALIPNVEDERVNSIRLTLQNEQGQKQSCTLDESWIITRNTDAGRTIETEDSPLHSVQQLAKLVSKGKMRVTVFGQQQAAGCYPSEIRIEE